MVKEIFTLSSKSQTRRALVEKSTDVNITITFDPSGVFIASKGGIEEDDEDEEEECEAAAQQQQQQENEPAWNFRLWGSSKQLARHLESMFEENPGAVPDCLLELGAGTGLPSIVAHKLGVPHVISTDLPRAMPLLFHNLADNVTLNSPRVKVETSDVPLCCPSGHLLQDEPVHSDEFMCSVCDEDIEKDAIVRRCRCCNFDLCHDHCLAAISSGNLDDLPLWFQTELKFRQEFGLVDMNSFQHEFPGIPNARSVSLCSCDWSSDADRTRLQSAIQNKPISSIFIVGADLSYSPQSVDALMSLLPKLTADLRGGSGGGSSAGLIEVRVLLMHQVRSITTSKRLLRALAATGWRLERRLLEVSADSGAGVMDTHGVEEEEEEEEDESVGLEVVKNGIYLIDIRLD